MPPPGDPRAARLMSSQLHDLIYDWLYAPVARGVIVRGRAAQ